MFADTLFKRTKLDKFKVEINKEKNKKPRKDSQQKSSRECSVKDVQN